MLKLTKPLLAGAVLLLSGCSFWAPGSNANRASVVLGDPDRTNIAASRPVWLAEQIVAMDDSAFGGPRAPLALKLSYGLKLPVRKV